MRRSKSVSYYLQDNERKVAVMQSIIRGEGNQIVQEIIDIYKDKQNKWMKECQNYMKELNMIFHKIEQTTKRTNR